MDISFRKLVTLIESQEEFYQTTLPGNRDDFEPVFSKETIDIHYGTLYKNYVDSAKGGDTSDFIQGGAYLHTLLFEQIQIPASSNKPSGSSKILIEKKFESFENFKNKIEEAVLDLHGSGWVYVNTSGAIKTIEKHKIVSGIALIIDCWEHAFIIDYHTDKKLYLKENWKTIDWEVVNARLNH